MKPLVQLNKEELITIYKALDHSAPALFTFRNAEHGRGVVEALALSKLKDGTAAERKLASMLLSGSATAATAAFTGSVAPVAPGSPASMTSLPSPRKKAPARKKGKEGAILKKAAQNQSPR